MTLLLIVTQPFTVGLVLWLVLRHATVRDQRFLTDLAIRDDRFATALKNERDAHQQTIDRLLASLEREREAKRDELQTLLQRIQAPEHAVVEHAQKTLPQDDTALPMSDAEMAERLNMIRDLEKLENATLP